ncbi:MAG: glycosyltransferase [Planctomycetia bacterium]|nr:glycosyltransferase [Planctomycetia bacterium]
MKITHDSLSIVLRVHNAQSGLARAVEQLVEAAAELTSRFELLIVDDGSTDATEEIAWELCTRFAQVRMVRQAQSIGATAALRLGLRHSSGEYLLLVEGPHMPRGEALAALWRARRTKPAASQSTSRWTTRLRNKVTGRTAAAERAAATGPWRLLKRADLAGIEPLVAERRSAFLDRSRHNATAPILPAADRAVAAWHNTADCGMSNV